MLTALHAGLVVVSPGCEDEPTQVSGGKFCKKCPEKALMRKYGNNASDLLRFSWLEKDNEINFNLRLQKMELLSD